MLDGPEKYCGEMNSQLAGEIVWRNDCSACFSRLLPLAVHPREVRRSRLSLMRRARSGCDSDPGATRE